MGGLSLRLRLYERKLHSVVGCLVTCEGTNRETGRLKFAAYFSSTLRLLILKNKAVQQKTAIHLWEEQRRQCIFGKKILQAIMKSVKGKVANQFWCAYRVRIRDCSSPGIGMLSRLGLKETCSGDRE